MSANRHLMTRDEYRHQKKENANQAGKTTSKITNQSTAPIDVGKDKSTDWKKILLYVIVAIIILWLAFMLISFIVHLTLSLISSIVAGINSFIEGIVSFGETLIVLAIIFWIIDVVFRPWRHYHWWF